jgi:pyruvate dehydrogenase E1 component
LEVQILGSGVIINEALRAQSILAEKYKIASTVYSVTSYQMLRKDALECERYNRLHPQQPPRVPYITQVLGPTRGPIVATSDYMRALPEQVAPYLGGRLYALGTDGFGRSDTRQALRRFFEIDAEHVVVAALYTLAQRKEIDTNEVTKAINEFGIRADAPPPWTV